MYFCNANHRGNTTATTLERKKRPKWTSKTHKHSQIADVEKKKQWLQIKWCCLTHCVCSEFVYLMVCCWFFFLLVRCFSSALARKQKALFIKFDANVWRGAARKNTVSFNKSRFQLFDFEKLRSNKIRHNSLNANECFVRILVSKIGQKRSPLKWRFDSGEKSVFQATESNKCYRKVAKKLS